MSSFPYFQQMHVPACLFTPDRRGSLTVHCERRRARGVSVLVLGAHGVPVGVGGLRRADLERRDAVLKRHVDPLPFVQLLLSLKDEDKAFQERESICQGDQP